MVSKFLASAALAAAFVAAPMMASAQDAPDYAAEIAALGGDAKKGRSAYNQCRACHVIDKEQNRVGPHQVGLFGRPAGVVEGFDYSDALLESEIVWDVATLQEFLQNPGDYVPGISRQMANVKVRENRVADLLTYMYETAGEYDGATN